MTKRKLHKNRQQGGKMEKDIREQLQEKINRKRKKLEKEAKLYREKMKDTEAYYGFGGPYMRQEAALERREQQLEELKDFENQLQRMKKHKKVRMYVFGCQSCRSTTMVTQQPFDDWHECPVCRNMIYLTKLKSAEIEITETGSNWQEMLEASLKENR